MERQETNVLQLTRREEFLINLICYLKAQNIEIEKTLNNKDAFLSIDIIADEMDYFDLSEEDFIWK